ncbi:hypothetical protein SRABI26_04179 [Arthrobacter sp. Bi26]|nr:hypothetical protein SRABI26_04179 [Arthrobacter sp. Bi26]
MRRVVAFLCLVELTSGILQGYYTPILTDIARHLGIHDADVNWFEAAQLMVSALAVPVLAKLGDMHGHHIVIGNRCSMGVDAWVNYGATMREGSSLGADAFLMKGEDVPENATFSGNPSREVMIPAAPAALAALVSSGPRHRDAAAATGGRLKLSKGTHGTHAAHGAHAARAAANAAHGTHRATRDKAGTPSSGS